MWRKEQVMELGVTELANSIEEPHTVVGSLNRRVRNARAIDQADDQSLCFCKFVGQRAIDLIRNSRAEVIICSDALELPDAENWEKTIIQVANPRLTYSRLLAKFLWQRPEPGIDPTAIIDERARIGTSVSIGPGAHIGNCEIGEHSVVQGQVYIHDDAKIGRAVIIQAGTVVGAESIAYERNESGALERFPQLAGVTIGDEVEIGANSVICRGSLSNTCIGEGTKIDSLVIISHGALVGKHCIVAGGVVICGSARIGDQSWLGPHSCIREGVTIGDRVTVGSGSVVHKDVASGLVVTGSPARPTISQPATKNGISESTNPAIDRSNSS